MKRLVVAALLLLPAAAPAANTQPVGAGINTACQNTAPGPAGTDRYWTRCSDDCAIHTNTSNVDICGTNGIVEWPVATPWATIYAQVQKLPPGTGAVIRLITPEAFAYHLTTGTFVMDNIAFESPNYTTLIMDAGFTVSDTGTAQLTFSGEIAVFTNGQHGSFAAQFSLNLLNSCLFSTAFASPANPAFVLAPGANVSINMVGGIIGGTDGGGTPPVFNAGNGVTVTLEVQSSSVVYGPLMSTAGTVAVDFDASYTSYIAGVNSVTSGPAFATTGGGSYSYNPGYGPASPNLYTGSGAVSIDFGLTPAPLQQFTATGNVSSLTLASSNPSGYAGLSFVLLLKQNAAGTATWPATIANVLFPAGGTFSKTLTANAVDRLDLIADGAGNYWAQNTAAGTLQRAYNNGVPSPTPTIYTDTTRGGFIIDAAHAYPSPWPYAGSDWPSPSPSPLPTAPAPGFDNLVFAAGNSTGPDRTAGSKGDFFGVTGAGEIVAFDPAVDGSWHGNQTQNWFQFFGGVDTTIKIGRSRKGQFFVEGGDLRIIGGDGCDNCAVTTASGGGVWMLGGFHGKNSPSRPDGMIIIDTGPNSANGESHDQPGYGHWAAVEAISIGETLAAGVGIGRNDLSGSPATEVNIFAGTTGLSMYSLGRWGVWNKQPASSATVYWDTAGAISGQTEFVTYDGEVSLITPSATGGNAQGWLWVTNHSMNFAAGASPTYHTAFVVTENAANYTTWDSDGGGKEAWIINSHSTWTSGTLLNVESNGQTRLQVLGGPGTPLTVSGNFSGLGQIKIADTGEGSARGSGIVFTDTGSNGWLMGTSSTATSSNFYFEQNGGAFAGVQIVYADGSIIPVNTTASDIGKTGSKWRDGWYSGTAYLANIENLTAGNEGATVGAAGSASTLPIAPLGYLAIKIHDGSTVVVPYYNHP